MFLPYAFSLVMHHNFLFLLSFDLNSFYNDSDPLLSNGMYENNITLQLC